MPASHVNHSSYWRDRRQDACIMRLFGSTLQDEVHEVIVFRFLLALHAPGEMYEMKTK
jgi:hypothetical protein